MRLKGLILRNPLKFLINVTDARWISYLEILYLLILIWVTIRPSFFSAFCENNLTIHIKSSSVSKSSLWPAIATPSPHTPYPIPQDTQTRITSPITTNIPISGLRPYETTCRIIFHRIEMKTPYWH